MELSPGRRRLLFVVVVIALVGLGFFLVKGRSQGATAASTTTPTPTPSSSAPLTSGAATATPSATEPSATSSATAAGPAGGEKGGANIYQWLPFTQSDLTTAAKTTLAFATDYVTWTSTESKAAYGAKMASLVTAQEDLTLEYDFSTAARAAGNAVSTGSAAIDSISSFGSNPASITFSVAITQQVVPAKGTLTSPSQYSITVVATAAGWQVNDIELSILGNQ